MGEAIIGLIALTAMEIVLGIDNIVFISIVTARLPENQRPLAWRAGLGLAMLLRILLLLDAQLDSGPDGARLYARVAGRLARVDHSAGRVRSGTGRRVAAFLGTRSTRSPGEI